MEEIIYCRPRTIMERIKRFLSPSYQAKWDTANKEAIRYLVANPDQPCVIDGQYISDGWGSNG